MADTSQCSEADELFLKLDRLVQARKKYPKIISDIESKIFDKELKSLQNIKVELDDDELKEVIMVNNDTRKKLIDIKNHQSSLLTTQATYLKAKKNMMAIESFLELRKTFK